jgi:hypothetical protein
VRSDLEEDRTIAGRLRRDVEAGPGMDLILDGGPITLTCTGAVASRIAPGYVDGDRWSPRTNRTLGSMGTGRRHARAPSD